MSRRLARKPCDASGKAKGAYRDRDAALWGARRTLRMAERLKGKIGSSRPLSGGRPISLPEALWVYRCRACNHWHLTSQDQGDADRMTAEEALK